MSAGIGGACTDAAFAIGARLARDALWDGARCNWLSPVFEEFGGSQQLGFGTLGPTLYDGSAGIGLFLAELHRATGDGVIAATAAGAIEHALSRVEDVPDGLRLGLYTGALGIGFAAARAGHSIGRRDFSERGAALVEEAVAAALAGDAPLDVMSGYAGAIPLLLRLGRKDAALEFGERLLARAVRSERGLSWDTTSDMKKMVEEMASEDMAEWLAGGGDHLTGYSHGAGGIALALLELAVASRERRFADAARGGFAYEDSWFDGERGWPDLRDKQHGGAAPSAWCHGAVGIGLARLRAFRLTGDPRYREGGLRALGIAGRALLAGLGGAHNFSLCHGAAGDAELFLLGAETLGDLEAAQLVAAVAWHGITSHDEPDMPWPSGVPGAGEAPGLMLGAAGTGYFYLRVADPRATPSVLLVTP